MEMDIGISKSHREAITEGLSRVLADTYVLYLKTHAYHWNVTGPLFSSLHLLFEAEYNELHDAGDTIAERIRSRAFRAGHLCHLFTAFQHRRRQ